MISSFSFEEEERENMDKVTKRISNVEYSLLSEKKNCAMIPMTTFSFAYTFCEHSFVLRFGIPFYAIFSFICSHPLRSSFAPLQPKFNRAARVWDISEANELQRFIFKQLFPRFRFRFIFILVLFLLVNPIE